MIDLSRQNEFDRNHVIQNTDITTTPSQTKNGKLPSSLLNSHIQVVLADRMSTGNRCDKCLITDTQMSAYFKQQDPSEEKKVSATVRGRGK